MKTLKMVSRRNVLMSIHVIFIFISVTLLSSCYATMQTPRSARGEVVITSQNRVDHQNSDDRHDRRQQRQERRHNHDNN